MTTLISSEQQLLCYCGGTAGTGKSFLLRVINEFLAEHVLFYATTGFAGASLPFPVSTIHSLSGLYSNFSKMLPQTVERKKEIFKNVYFLVIEEVSMLKQHELDKIDQQLRFLKDSSLYFGGISILLVGDFQ